MKKKIPFLILTVLILIFGGTYLYAFYSPGYNVAEIQIKGTKKISPGEIRKKAEWCLGKNINSLKLEKIRENLLTDARLRNVRVYKILPRSISVEVEEKTPVLWISLPTILPGAEEYGFFGLSIDQETIPLDKDDISRDLPLVSGIDVGELNGSSNGLLSPYQKYENSKTRTVLEFYWMLVKNDPDALKLLAEINMTDTPNLILYLLPFGNKVLIGPGDIEKKWNRVKTILSMEEKIEDLSCLDLRFDDQVVLTRSASSDSSAQTNGSKHTPDKMGKHLKNKRG